MSNSKCKYQLTEYMEKEEIHIYTEPLIRDHAEYRIKEVDGKFAVFTTGKIGGYK